MSLRWLFASALLVACSSTEPSRSGDAGVPDATGPVADAGRAQVDAQVDAQVPSVVDAAADAAPAEAGARATIPYLNPPLAAACGGRSRPPSDVAAPRFTKRVLAALPGAGYLLPRDLDADGYPELLVTALSEGLDLGAITAGPPLASGGAYVLARSAAAPAGTLPSFVAQKAFDRSAGVAWPGPTRARCSISTATVWTTG